MALECTHATRTLNTTGVIGLDMMETPYKGIIMDGSSILPASTTKVIRHLGHELSVHLTLEISYMFAGITV